MSLIGGFSATCVVIVALVVIVGGLDLLDFRYGRCPWLHYRLAGGDPEVREERSAPRDDGSGQ